MSSLGWQLDHVAASEALSTLLSARMVCLPTHQNVDADGISSALAILDGLRRKGGDGFVVISDGKLPKYLTFLPGSASVVIYGKDPLPEFDMLCLVDCSDQRRLGRFYSDDPARIDGQVPIVNIDHHVTNPKYGVVNIVEPRAAAAAEIVTDILEVWGIEFDVTLAQVLLAGIYGDTLGLRTDNTTARTMRTAASLVDAGAEVAPIVDSLFRLKSASTVCVWSRALESVAWQGSLLWTEVSRQLLADCNADASEAENLVNFLTGTEGSNLSAILYENENGWRVSMRTLTPSVDVAAIAAAFGGGGHPKAAGVQINGGIAERDDFLRRAEEMASEQAAT
ncbi:MAG: bifunctional oligoribonuclease/PAP phosphatase NrnA [Thermomicrobiales bacterium]|nr:MAG: bifunctional oligoribonuclease/PAP phosphatase NrnA [Thermomicrobiales bacterium]